MKLGHCMRRCSVWPVWCWLLLAVSPSRAATVTVDVGPGGTMSFSPDPVEINQGDTVKWVWSASSSGYGSIRMPHSVTSGTPSQPTDLFNSEIHYYPHSFQVSFPNAGTFPYFCMVHGAMMTSSVEVSAASPTATPSTSLGNISTRLSVQTGDNVLIAGFIVTGTQPKKVIVRGIGPSLPFSEALADPFLELHDGSGQLLESNDNWIDSSNKQAIIDSGLRPTNDVESAIVQTLPANGSAYTAIVSGANNGTGIGLVEAYDLDRTVDSKLANISTRGLVQTGDNVLIGGLIVLGQNPLRVIVRAIGPSLPVPGALGNPPLELNDARGAVIALNDDWRSDQEAEIIATGIPPANNLESAIVS